MIRSPSPTDASRLRGFFRDTGYTETGLLEALGTAQGPVPHLGDLPRFLHLTRERSTFNTLARWFLLTVEVDSAVAAETTPAWFREMCLECGLLRSEGDGIGATAHIVPFRDLLVAADTYHQLGSPSGAQHVLTLNPAARALLDCTLRRPVATTLDLCAGNGIQGLAAAGHSREVVATDLNPRATAYAAFNARLNGVENLRCLTGDAFDPVEGRTFDLIVCNPPFILSPASRFLYRDNELALDEFCRALARRALRHLNEGGIFQMICEWVGLHGQSWQERLEGWFADSGCDVWVLKDYTQQPSWYALTRTRETPRGSEAEDIAAYEEWMEHYRATGVQAIHGGRIALRRRTGRNWVRMEKCPSRRDSLLSEALWQGFQVRDFLEAHADDEPLLQTRPVLAPGVGLRQDYRWAEGQWRTVAISLHQERGLQRTVVVDGDVAQFLARLDGETPLVEVVDALAREVEVDPARVRRDCLATVRTLLDRGFLLPAELPRGEPTSE